MMRARATSEPRTLKHVLVGLQAELVVDAHRGDHDPELAGDLAADRRDAPQQVAAGGAVHERDEAEADGELQRVDGEPLQRLLGALAVPGLARSPGRCGGGERERRLGGVLLARQAVAHGPADRAEDRGDREERQLRQAGDEREQPDHGGGDERRFALAQDLRGDVGAEVFLGGGAGDDDAGGDGDQQRGDLGGEAVADGQQRELVGRFGEGQAVLGHADDDARRSG